jgi:hypothetical protein
MKKIKKVAKSLPSAPKSNAKAKAKPTKPTAARGISRKSKKTAQVKVNTPAKKRRTSAAPTPATKPALKPATPLATVVVRAPVFTTITARIDIGFGNALYLRGEGADLSWDRGTLMNCIADNCWSLELPASTRPVIFKFLVNDLSWSAGQDYVVASGDTLAITPTF